MGYEEESFINQLRITLEMEGIIVNFRGGIHTQKNNQMVISVPGVDSKEKATALVGKKVIWKSPSGKALTGTISFAHGNSGAVRALFDTGMPGQSVGSKIEIV
jgi:large subunit ribosomal protein L35Ae